MKFAVLAALVFGGIVQAQVNKVPFATSQEEVVRSATVGGLPKSVDGRTAALDVHDKRQLTNPLIVFCQKANCAADCVSFQLIQVSEDICLLPNPDPFASYFIDDPGNLELLFQVGVAQDPGCDIFENIIPETNACFNISPGGRSWSILDTGDTFPPV